MRRLLVMFAIPLLVLSACGETTKKEIADVLLISQDNVNLTYFCIINYQV